MKIQTASSPSPKETTNIIRLSDIQEKPWFIILVKHREFRSIEVEHGVRGEKYYGQKAKNANSTLKQARKRLKSALKRMPGEDIYAVQKLLAA